MISGVLVAVGIVALAFFAYVIALKRVIRSLQDKTSGEPTPEQARIQVDSQQKLERIGDNAEKAKDEIGKLSGDDLHKSFISNLLRKRK